MRNKSTWFNFGIGVGAYLLLILLAKQSVELLSFAPTLLVVGTLSMYLMIGFMQKDDGIWGGRLAVILPYIIGGIIYGIGRVGKNTELIALFRKIVPQVYQPLNKISLAIDQSVSRDILIVLLSIGFIVLGIVMLELGQRIKASDKNVAKFTYNLVLVWGIHFYLFLGTYAVLLLNPKFMSDSRLNILFAVGMTCVLFIVYFFAGRACRTISNKILQFLSCSSVSITGLMMYGLGLFLIWNIGIYERYMLPIATSFIGTICKAIGVATGAEAATVSRYGVLASVMMILIPVLLIFMGKVASIPEKSKEALQADLEEEMKVEIE